MMSKDKYPSIFSPQKKAIVFIILEIFFSTCTVLKIWGGNILRYSPVLVSWGIFGRVTCLGQLCESEKV